MIDPIRRAALSVLVGLEKNRLTLDHLLKNANDTVPEANRRDRNFIYVLTHGTLRWRGRLDWILAQVSKKPLQQMDPVVRNILRMGLFQILFLDRIPASATVNTSVDLTKKECSQKATGFVNAVLRNAIRREKDLKFPNPKKNPAKALAVQHSFPRWMVKRWLNRLGPAETTAMCQALNTIAPLTLRTNTLNSDRQTLFATLNAADQLPTRTPHSPLGLNLGSSHRLVKTLPGFVEGNFQVQDEAAQLVTYLLNPQPGDQVLDACAGLGGKTGHMAQLMKNRGKIAALDLNVSKLDQLSEEMNRLGVSIVSLKQVDLNDGSSVSKLGTYHRILLDAPCSGLGVLRRHPDGKWRHHPRSIIKMAERQKRFLARLAPQLKPGGILVYTVCSTEIEENEGVIDHFLKLHSNFIISSGRSNLPASARSLVTSKDYFCTAVHRDRMDGFFAVRLKKTDPVES